MDNVIYWCLFPILRKFPFSLTFCTFQKSLCSLLPLGSYRCYHVFGDLNFSSMGTACPPNLSESLPGVC